jgi:putative FmdB family regulatory protein
MPTYEYKCDNCEHTFEEFQSITAQPLKKCPSCGKLKLRRLIGTGAGIIFKGSGFYATDYRSDSYTQAAKSESTSSSPGDSKTTDTAAKTETATKSDTASKETKTESKPAVSESKTAESKPAPKKKSA